MSLSASIKFLFTTTTEQLRSWASSSIRRTSGLTEGEVHSGRGCASSSVGLVFRRARCASRYVFSEEYRAHSRQPPLPLDSTLVRWDDCVHHAPLTSGSVIGDHFPTVFPPILS